MLDKFTKMNYNILVNFTNMKISPNPTKQKNEKRDMEKNYNVRIEDNGAAYLIVVNKGTNNRFVVCSKSSLGEAWKHINGCIR